MALASVVALALIPLQPLVIGLSDKAQHVAAFFALTVLGYAAWGRQSWTVLFIALVVFGASIEAIQSTHWIGREADMLDMAADCAGVLLALAGMFFAERLLWSGQRACRRPKGGWFMDSSC
jgi:VanZ family protein